MSLYEFETLLLVRGDSGLEENTVGPELSVEQRHVAVHLGEEVDAVVALLQSGE
jgi:hypothetical protein